MSTYFDKKMHFFSFYQFFTKRLFIAAMFITILCNPCFLFITLITTCITLFSSLIFVNNSLFCFLFFCYCKPFVTEKKIFIFVQSAHLQQLSMIFQKNISFVLSDFFFYIRIFKHNSPGTQKRDRQNTSHRSRFSDSLWQNAYCK